MEAKIEEIDQKIKEAESSFRIQKMNNNNVESARLYREIIQLKDERKLLLQPAQTPAQKPAQKPAKKPAQKPAQKPKDPWADPRACRHLPSGCPKPLCVELPKHDRCKPEKIMNRFQPLIDSRNAELNQINAQLAAEQEPCDLLRSQIAATKKGHADCISAKAACESKAGGARRKVHKRGQKKKKQRGGETPQQLTQRLEDEAKALYQQIEAAKQQLKTGAKCSNDLSALQNELASIKKTLAECDTQKNVACAKPIDNGAFNLNTRADMNHVRSGGRKVYGTYQRGPKKGKLKKGYKFVNGVATKATKQK